MKKICTLFMVMIISISCVVSVNANDTTGIVVETPVEMTFVSEADGNYEYNVAVNATVTKNDSVVENAKVSILMFSNRDNTAFVSGNNVVNLTAEEIAADYYICYVDQTVSDNDGKATFDFNIILPSPAKADAYHVWVGAEISESANKLSTEDLSISSEIVAVNLVPGSTEAIVGESVTLSPDAVNVFGNSVPGTEYSYSVMQDGVLTETSISENILFTFGLTGIYNISVTATTPDGITVTSDVISLSVDGTTLLGDPDGNKRITVLDAVAILKHIASTSPIEGKAANAGDINRNGIIDIQDASRLLKYIARLTNSF